MLSGWFLKQEIAYTRVSMQDDDDFDGDDILQSTVQSHRKNDMFSLIKNLVIVILLMALVAIHFERKQTNAAELIPAVKSAANEEKLRRELENLKKTSAKALEECRSQVEELKSKLKVRVTEIKSVKLSSNLSPISAPDDVLPIMKRPLLIISAGLARTGSTGLYNILRSWVTLTDPNAVFGWKFAPKQIDAMAKENVTTLVKLHIPIKFDAVPDLVFFSHRKPSDTYCSLRLMGFDKFGEKSCQHFMEIQQRLYKWADVMGAKKIYDMDFRDWTEKPLEVVREIGRLLGVQPIREQDVRWVHRQASSTTGFDFVADLMPAHHPVTLLHAKHTHSEEVRKQMCANTTAIVKRRCPNWEKRFGEFSANERKKNVNIAYQDWTPDFLPKQCLEELTKSECLS